MFCFLSKKISIPNQIKLHAIAWNWEAGWIACGGEKGLLKVLLLDHGPKDTRIMGGTNLSVNQALEGHNDSNLVSMAWSHQTEKLTTADSKGSVIVWRLLRGTWVQDMNNDRLQSFVTDMSWSADGLLVCLVYDDGHVIVGQAAGKRVWSRELKRQLRKVAWSPDGRYLLIGTSSGEVLINDATTGQHLTKVVIRCVDENNDNKLAGIAWHMGSHVHCGETVGALAIIYESGKGQIMRNEHDDRPFLISTGLKVSHVSWNPDGTILAVGGTSAAGMDSNHVMVQFFSCYGKPLRTLRVPGKHFGGMTWEGSGLRMALAIDSCIYFANIRPDYKWTYISNTAVYAFTKPERNDHSIMFWNTKTNEKNIKNVRRVKHIKSAGDTCAIISQAEDSQTQHIIALNNEVGTPFTTKHVEIEPSFAAMNSFAVVLASDEYICVWQYRSPTVVIDALDPLSVATSRPKDAVERVFHVEDLVSKDSVQAAVNTRKVGLTNDLIFSVHMNDTYLIVGRESGLVQIYTLGPVALVAKHKLLAPPQYMEFNSDSSMLGVIDNNSILNLYKVVPEKFNVVTNEMESVKNFERKEVWGLAFASDNPDMFAVMEKTRMYIFRGLEPEEPIMSNAHPCRFESLRMRAINLDDTLYSNPEAPHKNANVDFETKSLRDTRALLKDVGFKDAVQYAEDHSHPRLWSLIAEAALEELDFVVAEKAVSRCREYPAIQFVKRVKALDDATKQKAEVLAYYHRFDEAERLYREMDRRDLAVEMRARLGDWFRVVQLVQEGAGDDSMIQQAWENIGDHYADRQKWSKAAEYYALCKQYEKLAYVHYVRDDFRALERLIEEAQHDRPFLISLGDKLLSVGIVESAVNAYLTAGEVRMAVDCCVELHHWDKAVALAEKHKITDIGKYLTKYAAHLVEKNKIPQAIELNRKAGQNNEAAKLLSRLGQQAAAQQLPLKAKKFYVLAALEIETYRRRQVRGAEAKSAAEVADELLAADKAMAEDRSLDSAWRGAEAFHFFMLCQSFLYANNVEAALIVAMRLMEYDDIIAPRDSYSLIALTSYYAKNFGICSKAMTRLEMLEAEMDEKAAESENEGVSAAALASLLEFDTNLDITQTGVAGAMSQLTRRTGGGGSAFGSVGGARVDKPKPCSLLAVQIFTRHMPVDTSVDRVRCPKCGAYNKDWASACTGCSTPFTSCIVTGRAMPHLSGWHCLTCRHHGSETEIAKYKNCPLCHTPI